MDIVAERDVYEWIIFQLLIINTKLPNVYIVIVNICMTNL